jgi:hypothetical protein
LAVPDPLRMSIICRVPSGVQMNAVVPAFIRRERQRWARAGRSPQGPLEGLPGSFPGSAARGSPNVFMAGILAVVSQEWSTSTPDNSYNQRPAGSARKPLSLPIASQPKRPRRSPRLTGIFAVVFIFGLVPSHARDRRCLSEASVGARQPCKCHDTSTRAPDTRSTTTTRRLSIDSRLFEANAAGRVGLGGSYGSFPAGRYSRLIVLLCWPLAFHVNWNVQQPAVGTSTMLGPPSAIVTTGWV